MQNHLEISSKIQFWTRNKRNWTNSMKYRPTWARPCSLKSGKVQEKNACFFYTCLSEIVVFDSRQRFFMVLTCSWAFWLNYDTERLWNHIKKQVLEPQRALLRKSYLYHPALSNLLHRVSHREATFLKFCWWIRGSGCKSYTNRCVFRCFRGDF